ncbi:hypothetical protein B0H66DRAFT_5352 [Apodospora peruviana]|uniref:Uncharacterized protein n=1 Tax=Apodospora peruviana TaxID=516989 RepID=A0AAE0IPY1_9PEZI|nr:hypothetical protein B0H66DRAFT_5352 [Apodospora peruviana]
MCEAGKGVPHLSLGTSEVGYLEKLSTLQQCAEVSWEGHGCHVHDSLTLWERSFITHPNAIPMRQRPCCSPRRLDQGEEPSGRSSGLFKEVWSWLSETVEIGLGTLCGGVTWRFMLETESTQEGNSDHGQHIEESYSDNFILHPPPGLMLFSCLVFGCCVSSFVHRRQDKDPFQFLVYIVLLATVVIIGHGTRASANMILLGYLPWTMCAAMAISISGHGLYRLQRPGVRSGFGDEKMQLLLR